MAEPWHGTNAGWYRHYRYGTKPCDACVTARRARDREAARRRAAARPKKIPGLRERLLSRLILDPESGCLLWDGLKNQYGYGVIKNSGRRLATHRVMYELFAGPIPEGLQIDHLCRVRHCANVAHLEPVTGRENQLRGLTIGAANAAKTHCIHGHEFTPENTYIRPTGRGCRACKRAESRSRIEVRELEAMLAREDRRG